MKAHKAIEEVVTGRPGLWFSVVKLANQFGTSPAQIRRMAIFKGWTISRDSTEIMLDN